MTDKKPNFDRDGKETRGVAYWLTFLGGMGSDGPKGALFKWATVALFAVSVKRYINTGALPSLADLTLWKKKGVN